MRRVFVIRKDLHLKPGKLAAMVGHCCEAYWTNLLKREFAQAQKDRLAEIEEDHIRFPIHVDRDAWDGYVNDIFTKTICEAKNLKQLNDKALPVIGELGLEEDVDWGYINDKCLTDLIPENDDGTTTIGMWFRPLQDEQSHMISKKFKLYGAFD